jgi:hypothetical protein
MDARRIIIFTLLTLLAFVNVCAIDLKITPGEYAIEKALHHAREMRRLQGVIDIDIHLSEGTYRLYQSVVIRPEDNHTHFIADGKVIINGGIKINDWKKKGNYYVADVPDFNGRPLEFRQIWINGKKAVRARDVQDFEKMNRIKSVDKQNETIWVPTNAVRKIEKTRYAEMVLHEMWCIANLRIKSITIDDDSAAIRFCQPESHIQFSHPWPSPVVDGKHNSPFYLTNAKELLDTPGEWYLDSHEGKVYYIPRKGEDMSKADVEVPAIETLFKINGMPDEPVNDVTFRNIIFSYSTWMRPSIEGHSPLQAGMYMTEAYKLTPKMERPNGDHKLDNQGWVGRPAAAITVGCSENISFDKCTFEHIASTAIDYGDYTKGGNIEGCTIHDVGGNGIVAGSFGGKYFEAHKAYNPSDSRIICTDLNIKNNLITDIANEDWGCTAICAGFVKGIQIIHNEISEVSYTGISLGWGWNMQPSAMRDNLVIGNLIYHYAMHMYDTAGIYTLGNQPGTLITDNVIRDICTPSYVHDPNHWFYLYTDEGSSNITIKDNWTPSEKYLKNANGPGNIWENNGPKVSDEIKKKAGREKYLNI